MPAQKHTRPNALIHETSPYLLQHAQNPVDWHPWGHEALEKARREEKLIIISIGYSSCHWCHVMERESFEDTGVAALMNEHFVSIKVDREERPDIDTIYMTAVTLLDQRGGWPLNCVALPDGRPIWGGTYFPREQWMDVLRQVHAYYRDNPEKTRQYADELADGIRRHSLFMPVRVAGEPDAEEIHRAVERWSRQFDPENGGHHGAPKFPMPVVLEFLLHYGYMYRNTRILDHVERTLLQMARGGIYDQAGGGFARYSVDPFWKVPHFEKMLYDNAQLIRLYAHAAQAFGRETYARVVRETIGFVSRDLLSPEGAFYSALDADSEGEEGRYYVWEKDELQQLLKEDFDLFAGYYNVNANGLWEKDRYILHRSNDPEGFATANGLETEEFIRKTERWKSILLDARASRSAPGLDDKSLTSWSALMISGLTAAYRALGDEEYLALAVRGARLIRDRNYTPGRELLRTYKEGKSTIPAFHTDYAQLIEASLDLFEAGMEQEWLDLAQDLTGKAMDLFLDRESGMFLFNPSGSEIPVTNTTEIQDNVIPSSNSVMAGNLFRMGHMLTNTEYLELARSMTANMAGKFLQYPHGFAGWGRLLLWQVSPFYELVVTGKDALPTARTLMKDYLPHAIVVATEKEGKIPLFEERIDQSKTRIFVCRDNSCHLPVHSPEDAKTIYHPAINRP